MVPQAINWAIYNSLPPNEAQYQLAHVHDSKRRSIAATYIVCIPIVFLSVMMRFVSRRIGRTSYGADDWTMVLGLVLVVADCTPALLAAFVYGGAHHAILMTDNDPVRFAKAVFASEILYAPTIGIVKISTLLLFARIFPGQKFKRMLWAVGIFISTYSAIMVLAMIFQCRPINRVWDSTIKADCIDTSKVWIVMASMNVLTDFLILCLPLPELWKLQMRRETKIQLIGIFSIGSFTTVISIYRIPQLRGLSLYSYDPTWSDVGPSLWSIVEGSSAVLGASAITYRPLFNWIFRRHSSTPEPMGGTSPSRLVARKGSGPIPGTILKMQALDSLPPSVPRSIHSSRTPAREDGFYRIQDPVDV
ncbi:hypothetical protein BDR22DRAFT_890101 [Usnea florida]